VGFYVLLALMLALGVWVAFLWRRRQMARFYRRAAIAELDAIARELEKKGGRHVLAARLPELLKRVALHVEPRAEVAALTGQGWLTLLDRMYGGNGFVKGPGRLLPRLAYGTPTFISSVPRADIDALVRLSREWILKHRPLTLAERVEGAALGEGTAA
jgi:hypothetical protein